MYELASQLSAEFVTLNIIADVEFKSVAVKCTISISSVLIYIGYGNMPYFIVNVLLSRVASSLVVRVNIIKTV